MHGRNWQRNLDRKGGQAIATVLVLLVLLAATWVVRQVVPPRTIPVVVRQGPPR
jgi:hypothetical protein